MIKRAELDKTCWLHNSQRATDKVVNEPELGHYITVLTCEWLLIPLRNSPSGSLSTADFPYFSDWIWLENRFSVLPKIDNKSVFSNFYAFCCQRFSDIFCFRSFEFWGFLFSEGAMTIGERIGFVTLATTDSYAAGALVLARSLRQTNTVAELVCLVRICSFNLLLT